MHRFHTIFREGKPVTETSCCEIRSDSPRRCRQTGLCIWHFPWRRGSQPLPSARDLAKCCKLPIEFRGRAPVAKRFSWFQRHQTAGLSWGCLGPSLGVHGLLAPLKSGAAIQYLFGFFEPTRVCSQTASRSTQPFLCGRDQHTDRPHHAVCTL